MDTQKAFREMQEIADYICRVEGLPPIPLILRDALSYGGKAFLPGKKRSQGYIAIAKNELRQTANEDWLCHVVIHEVCHFIYWREYKRNGNGNGPDHHGPEFREIETKWNKSFGMVPIYSRAYAKMLLDFDGNILWSRNGWAS